MTKSYILRRSIYLRAPARTKVKSQDLVDTGTVMIGSNDTIKLDQFLKLIGIASTGGQAKLIIQNGEVLVNGILETRRGRKLRSGDRVTVVEQTFEVNLDEV